MSDPNLTGGGVAGMWSPQDLIGTTLADRYQVQRVIGDGGMGSVYEAQHITLRKRVALKVLHPELCRDQTHVDRFLQEARAASMIEHDNIVDIVDFGPVPGGSVFFAMEYLEGTDLAGVVKNEGRLSWPRVQDLMVQIVGALAAAHKKKIIHRDLKPANCFVINKRGREHIKLLDFGIAKVTDENNDKGLTRTGAVFGTAKYMAPEQACGETADNRTDIYAAAVVMYELLTGQVPYDGDNFMRVLSRHLTEPLTLPSTMAPDAAIPPTVESIVVKALSKKREDRYQSMEELAAALQAVGPDGNLRRDLMAQGPPLAGPGYSQGGPLEGPGHTLWMGQQGSQGPASQPPEGRGGTVMLDSSAAPSGAIPVGRTEFADSSALTPALGGGVPAGTMLMDGPAGAGDPITGRPPGASAPGPMGFAPGRPGSQPPPGAHPSTNPPSPETRPPTAADLTQNPDYTEFGEKKSKAGFLALVIGGAIAAIGGGGLVAWLLLDDPGKDATEVTEAAKVERDHGAVPEPVVEKTPEPELDPVEPEIPEPEDPKPPEPDKPPPEPTEGKAPKTTPNTTKKPPPDRDKPRPATRTDKDIRKGFAKANKAAKECGSRFGALPGQVIEVEAGISKSGSVVSATATGPNRSTPLGKCVAKAIKDRAKFPKSTQLLETQRHSVKM